METINNLDDIYSRDFLEIKEQNLILVLDKRYSIYSIKDNMIVVIGSELNYYNGQNMGDLMTGIIKLESVVLEGVEKTISKLVLPFSKKLLYAKFLNKNELSLAFVVDKHLTNKVIRFQDNGTLLFEDYAFLLEDDKPKIVNFPSNVYVKNSTRVLSRSKIC